MTIGRRVGITAGFLLISVLGTGLMLFWSSHQVADGIQQAEANSRIVRSTFMLRTLMDEYLIDGDKRPLRQWYKHREIIDQILNSKETLHSVDPILIEDLKDKSRKVDSLSRQAIQLRALEDGGERNQNLEAKKKIIFGLLYRSLEELAKDADDLSVEVLDDTLNKRTFVQGIILATGLSMGIIILINIYLIRKSVVRPLKVISDGAESIGAGNFEQVAEIKSDDEVGKLSQAFNTMVERLGERDTALAKARDELERKVLDRTAELRLANERLVLEIEERKRAEERITAERQRLYDVLETLPVYVCLLDADYRMPFANRYFRETFGEPLGRRCHDFLFNLTVPCEICETYTVMKTREPHHWYWTGPNGRDYDIYDFPFIDTDGSFLILEMGIDITERNKAEEGLRQTFADLARSNEDLQQFAYVASHDLQEPLRNVASCLQLLEKKYKNKLDAKADQYIDYAVDSAVRMKALIQDLLAYSRVGTKGKPPKQTDCEQLLDQAVKNLRSAISEAGAVITHDPLPTVLADDAQLMQVFQNLIWNSIKFRREEQPHVHMSAVKNKREWIFSVKDNGIGIESRHLDRIFMIFQRLHKRS